MSEHAPDVSFEPDYLIASAADQLLEHCLLHLPWAQERITLFGKSVLQPRLQVWMGDQEARYRYSGTDFQPVPWEARIKQLADKLSSHCGVPFNSVLCNWYRGGDDSMGWHADDEPELGVQPVIASVSLGDTRRFLFRHRISKSRKVEYQLGHGSLLVMRGNTQAHWHHSIPKTRLYVTNRVNLTFRRILTTGS